MPVNYDTKQIDYKAHSPYEAFHNSTIKHKALVGPVGSGKSLACCAEIVRNIFAHEPCNDGTRRVRVVVIRNTLRQLKDTTIKTWLDLFPSGTLGKMQSINKLPEYIIDNPEQRIYAEILFRGLDRPEHKANLLSMEFTFAWGNEVREFHQEIFDFLDTRTGRYPPKWMKPSHVEHWPTWHGGIYDTNPPDEEHWFYDLFETKRTEDRQVAAKYMVWHIPKGTNTEFLPDNYYEEIAIGKSPQWVKVYCDGEYGLVHEGKIVYPEYSDFMHCREDNYDPVANVEIIRGWDIGGGTLQPAIVFLQINHGIEIFDEFIMSDCGIHRFKQRTLEYCGRFYPDFEFRDFGDPAMLSRNAGDEEERTTQEIIASGKYRIVILPGETSFTGRRESIARVLLLNAPPEGSREAQPYVRISPRCKMTRQGFKGRYEYPEIGNTGRYHNKPLKNQWSHPMNALEYAISGLFAPYEKKHEDAKKQYVPIRPPTAMAA